MAGNPASAHRELPPFLIEPHFDTRVWGYHDLRPWYDYLAEEKNGGNPVGEVWLTGDQCRVATGPFAGRKLGEVFSEIPATMLGTDAPSPQSPLLVKVLFAREKLSVQVHPDDRLARKYGEPRGKTECWYALSGDPAAQVALGLKPGVTLEEVRREIEQGTLEQSLNVVSVRKGEMVFVDAGTVHAIWPGSILLETQQNSDVTYRMYDYGRPRELHIEKSLEALRLETRAGIVPPRTLDDRTILIDVEYFRVERIPVEGARDSATLPGPGEPPGTLAYLFAADGAGRLTGEFGMVELPPRSIAAIPALAPSFKLEDLGGLDLIRISPRWPRNPL
jgi:mannose-6-phosphate isomerase